MSDFYIPIRMCVGTVLSYLVESLPITEFDHSLIVDEFLADLFFNFQSEYEGHTGPHAVVHRRNCGHYFSKEIFEEVFTQSRNILIESICSIWPDYRPGIDKSTYYYNGGSDLLVYMPYVPEKHTYVSRKILVPWEAIANHGPRTQYQA